MIKFEVKNFSWIFGFICVVEDVFLNVDEGEFVCFFGLFGFGKLIVFRMIGGFECLSIGFILIDGVDVMNVLFERWVIGMVFQSYVLWIYMNVFVNVVFGLKFRWFGCEEIRMRMECVFNMVGFIGYGNCCLSQFLGGQ